MKKLRAILVLEDHGWKNLLCGIVWFTLGENFD
jgi:hypothetical protein